MENQTQLNQERIELLEKLSGAIPNFTAAESELLNLAYADGALSGKVKRLMAMTIALKVGCTNCILAQTQKAIDLGASKEEILESLQVVIAMGGTTGIAESLRVIKFLDEMGEL
jgi:AhpD family alkylhydroperoxidase